MRTKPPAVGDTVVCRLYNAPEGRFYGDSWTGRVVAINLGADRPFTVTRPSGFDIDLWRKEIKSIIARGGADVQANDSSRYCT